MSYDNVVPIDADVARLLARRQIRFRWFVCVLTAVWIALLVPVLALTPLPPIGPFVALAILVVLAEHRFVLFGDETSMSASIIVVVASVFVFASTSPLAGPMLIASLAGLYLPHLRRGSFALVLANASTFGTSALIAAALTGGMMSGSAGTVSGGFASAAVCAAAYWYANSVLTGLASAIRNEDLISRSVLDQATSEWPVLLLSLSAGLASLRFGSNAALITTAIALLLGLFEIYVRREWLPRARTIGNNLSLTAFATMLCTMLLHQSLTSAAIGLAGAFLIVGKNGPPDRRTVLKGAMIVCLVVCASLATRLGMALALQAPLFFALAAAILGGIELAPVRQTSPQLPRLVRVGLVLPGYAECGALLLVASALAIGEPLLGNSARTVAFVLSMTVLETWGRGMLRRRSHDGVTRRSTSPRTSVSASR